MKVLKPFSTRLQRFKEGDKVAETADLSPHTVGSLVAGNFLASAVKTSPAPAKGKASK